MTVDLLKSNAKSKTNWTALLIGVLGIIELNAPLIKPMLGDYYGASYIGISILMFILRQVTTNAVGEK